MWGISWSLVHVQSSSFTAVQTGVIFPAAFWGNVTFFVLLAVRALLFYKPSSLLSLQRVPEAQSHCLTYYVSLNVTFYGLHYWSDSSRCEPLYSRVFIYTHLCLPTQLWKSRPPRTTSKPSRAALPILHTQEKNANETVDPSAPVLLQENRLGKLDNVHQTLFPLGFRITALASSVPSASTSPWATKSRLRRRTVSRWRWCVLTWWTRACSEDAE